MKFTMGLLTGIALGAAGAVAYSVTTGRDLREVYEQVKSSLADSDRDIAGLHLDARFAEAQSRIEERIAQVRGQAPAAVADAIDVAEATVEQAADSAADVAADVATQDQTGA